MRTLKGYNDFNSCAFLPPQVLKQNVRPVSFSVEMVAASHLSGNVTEMRTALTAAMRTPVVRN